MLKLGHAWSDEDYPWMGRKCINRSQASYCMCVSFTSAESCAKLQYTMLSLRSHTSRDVLDQLLLA